MAEVVSTVLLEANSFHVVLLYSQGEMSPSHSFGSPSHATVPMIPANQQPSPQVGPMTTPCLPG